MFSSIKSFPHETNTNVTCYTHFFIYIYIYIYIYIHPLEIYYSDSVKDPLPMKGLIITKS